MGSRFQRHGFESESDLAKVVLAWLRADGWSCFQEVEHRGDIADIVATRGEEVAVVEAKLTMGLTVLDQAHRWKDRAHLVYAAVPSYGARDLRSFAAVVCAALGIGLLEVVPPLLRGDQGRVRVAVAPQPNTSTGGALLAALKPEHATYAEAGSPTGHRWTRFRETEKALVAYVAEHPGELAKDVLKQIRHHWSGKRPEATMTALVARGVITGIRVETEGRRARLYPVDRPAHQTSTPPVDVSVDDAEASRSAAPETPTRDVDVSRPVTLTGGSVTGPSPEPPQAAPAPPPAPPSSTATSSPTTPRRRRRSWRAQRGSP